MTARRAWTAGASTFTDDSDGVVREWDTATGRHIATHRPEATA